MSNKQHIYFLGIGGIGMSSLARYLHSQGNQISGYDKTETELTRVLMEEGMNISFTENIDLISDDIDYVVWTPAIPKANLIYQHFVQTNKTMIKRSALLGKLTSEHKNIAIAGTHGKTTTSTLLTHLLIHSKFSVTAFLGGISTNYNTNVLMNGSQWMIEEADEYDQSFLQLNPDMAVITSLDPDHLDIYNTHDNMLDAYGNFASKIREHGILLMAHQIPEKHQELIKKQIHPSIQYQTYGFNSTDISCTIDQYSNGWIHFTYSDKYITLKDLKIKLPGKHNVLNATAAIRIARGLGLEEAQIRSGLESFQGIKRRFEWLHEGDQILIDDYAHHPEELKAAIEAVKSCYPERKILGVFQPHLYSRTKDFAAEFADVLDQLDEIILVDLYPARELPLEGISSYTILDKMENPNKTYVHQTELINHLKNKQLDVVILLGAGDLSFRQNEIKKLLN